MTKKYLILILIIALLLIVLKKTILKNNELNNNLTTVTPSISKCIDITSEQAVEIVRNLPEVQEFMNKGKQTTEKQQSTPITRLDKETEGSFTIQVFSMEDYTDETVPSHTATFNWYTVNKCNGEIKCSFNIYKNGEFERVSEQNEYPCE